VQAWQHEHFEISVDAVEWMAVDLIGMCAASFRFRLSPAAQVCK
jgi:hypothetical protein